MAAVVAAPFQPPTVNTAPTSPASSTSTNEPAPRPVQLSPSGIWKPNPTLKSTKSAQNFSLPTALPTPPTSAPITPSTTTTVVATPKSTVTPTSARLSSLTKPAVTLTPATPRSILKPGDVHPANRLPAHSPTSSTSSSSLNYTSKYKFKSKAQLQSPPNASNNKRRSRGKSIKEGAFFAFVLLPLSCWYTRGGKRLGGGASGPPPPQEVEYGYGNGGKRGVIEWDADEEYDDEEVLAAEYERRGRPATNTFAPSALPELRKPGSRLGRKYSFGQIGGGGGAAAAAGGMKSQVITRRESFSTPVPQGVSVGRGNGNGRSNSFTSAGMRGRWDGMGAGIGVPRREFADYGVDKGPAAAEGNEWDLEKERESERLRLSRAKSRTGSPVPLRRRRSEV
ncbi:hypothetical protein ONS95_006556 [Cadophora gregata]|uniref:uncharacterized protein n=1 Tax=Cadophora gregata TaxID=51156 RepID=UPI0026DA7CCF|nr:uncharacterized protein ONS95_006556 [Cadophora gregata]KAK0101381.1 hypothetical protein ONS95_006556 [Cadophora gregata]